MKTGYKIFTIALILMFLSAALPVTKAAVADSPVVLYNSINAPLEPSYPSLAYQARQTYEYGDYVVLTDGGYKANSVTVTMVTWAYRSGYPGYGTDSGWDHPFTLNLYNVVKGDETSPNKTGTLIGTVTETKTIPWRPEPDTTNCGAGATQWRTPDGTCANGYAFNLTFDLSGQNFILPKDVIVSVAFNTQTWGPNPTGEPGPYTSLNIGTGGTVTSGADGNGIEQLFHDSKTEGHWYGTNKTPGVFGEDSNWTTYGTTPIQITGTPGPCTTTCYVAFDGDDTAFGNADSPLKTINFAISKVSAGGTVLVGPGTYLQLDPGNSQAAIKITKALTLKSTGVAANTIIDVADGTLTRGIQVIGTDLGEVTIDGFTVQGFTESGILQGMAAGPGTTVHVLNNVVTPRGSYLRNGIQVSGDNSTVKGNIVNGARLTPDWASTAIHVVNASNVTVENNTIHGDTPYGLDTGIGVTHWSTTIGPMTGIVIKNNTITKANYPFYLHTQYGASKIDGVTFELNRVTQFIEAVDKYGPGTVSNIDASPNWWGSAAGPLSGSVMTGVPYAPWCANEACTLFAPVDGQIILPPGVTADQIQQAIDNAPEHTTIVVPPGTYTFTGGYHVDRPHLTIKLMKGVIIINNSPCFAINADYTTITHEVIGGAKCIPTGGSNGIQVNGDRLNIVIEGLEIDGTGQSTGNGIHFAGSITDVVIANNKIHHLGGNGLHFSAKPLNVVEVQGNLFQNNGGVGISSIGDFDAKYNSWGHLDGPAAGDGVTGVNTHTPFTHVALSLATSTTPVLNTVVIGNNIVVTVKADLANVTGATFDLAYDKDKLEVVSIVDGSVFSGLFGATNQTTHTPGSGKIHYAGSVAYGGDAKTVTGATLYTVTFKGIGAGAAALTFDNSADLFAMAPGYGPSNFIYASALTDASIEVKSALDVTDVALEESVNGSVWNPVLGSLSSGYMMWLNPANEFEFLDAASVTTADGRKLADGLYPFKVNQTDLPAEFMSYWAGKGVDSSATIGTWEYVMYQIITGAQPMFYLKVSGTGTSFDLIDGLQYLHSGTEKPLRVSGDFPAIGLYFNGTVTDQFGGTDALSVYIAFKGTYKITGTFSMQGRSVREGIPVTLTDTATSFGPFNADSNNNLSGNVIFTAVEDGTYTITTNQPRYLNVYAGLNKTKAISAATTLTSLQLKGGNANYADNIVDVSDAGVVGNGWGTGTISHNGDVNFSGAVDILDLSLVGANYNMTSASAYGSWIP